MFIFIFFQFLGVWLSAFSLGNFVGPTIAGCLVDSLSTVEDPDLGFRQTTLMFFVLYAVMILVDIFEAMHTFKRDSRRRQYENLDYVD